MCMRMLDLTQNAIVLEHYWKGQWGKGGLLFSLLFFVLEGQNFKM